MRKNKSRLQAKETLTLSLVYWNLLNTRFYTIFLGFHNFTIGGWSSREFVSSVDI